MNFMVQPLVSVLMTAYNREKYIGEAIESVINSTYKNLELIIVDDGSKDATVEIARSYAAKDKRISVYVNEKNLGDYPNRNRAASYAKGKYLKYVDSDDKMYPWGLEVMVKTMERFSNAGWGASVKEDKDQMYPIELSARASYEFHYEKPTGLFHVSPLETIIRKDAFNEVGGFSGKQHLGDFELWHLLALKFSVALIPKGLGWCRHHSDQQMEANRSDCRVFFKYDVAALNFFKQENKIPLSSTQKGAIKRMYLFRLRKTILRECIYGKLSLSRDLIKLFKTDKYNFKKI